MRELVLLRHAKSSWDDPSLDDFDRRLSKRGTETAPVMGRAMTARGWIPDAALVSAAVRTRETWRLVAAELGQGAPPEAEYAKGLYTAPAGNILRFVNDVPADTKRLLVVGHNPGIGDLALRLSSADSDAAALARMGMKFPTAALAHFEVDRPWSELEVGSVRLTAFLRPRDMGEE